MKYKKALLGTFVLIGLTVMFTITASANSIWTERMENYSYMEHFPYIIIGTLIVETLALLVVTKMKKPLKVIGTVVLANAASFLIPEAIMNLILFGGQRFELFMLFNTYWFLNVIFIIITLAIELPIIWAILKKDVKSVKVLLLTATAVNIFTTVVTAIIDIQIYNWLLAG